ncbi:MAG: sugar phosphate nucleotidyltransferase [Candidatus Nanoarchaeia archaeon]|nr:sugar phosphate nucleotidyltransferase [Candidatus Nanoarchaeia archaeon]
MKALILAGGRGSRLNKLTENRNKSMIRLFEKPLIEYNLEHAFEAGVSEIIIVVGYKKEEIIKYVGNEYKGIKIKYVNISEDKIKEGLVTGIEVAKEAIGKSDFMLMLADEILVDADLKNMIKKFRKEEIIAVCGITFEEDKLSIGKTYSAMINEDWRVFRLIEKPRVPINKIKGTGHILLKNEILEYIERTPINAYRNQKELVDLIQVAVDDGKPVYVYPITKGYVNVNTEEDLNLAKELIKKSNPRVLIVHTQMKYYGGAELLIVELANWLTKKGIKNDILALSKSKEVENLLLNTNIIIPKHNINLEPPGFKNIKDIVKFIKVYRKELKRLSKNYEVINFHDFPVTWTLFPRKKSSVWFMNLPPNLWSKPNAGFFYKTLNKLRIFADKIIVRSSVDIIAVAENSNMKRAIERYGKIPRMVHFGINQDLFSKGDKNKMIKKFNLKNRFVVLQSGIIGEARNQMTSIMAIESVRRKIPNILLILTGKEDPEYKKKLEDYIAKKGLEQNVKFIGMFENREDLSNLYKAAKIGLFPIGGQGGVLAPYEMLCSGTPIIISENMETAQMTREHNLGIVTKDYDKALLEIYNNYENYKSQAKAASIWIKKNLSWASFTDRMIIAFKDAWNGQQE